MHIQHLAQTAKGWPKDTAENCKEGARLVDVVEEHIRWRVWHGQVQRALDLIGETLGTLEATANDAASPVAAQAGKVAAALRSLETYVAGQPRRADGEPGRRVAGFADMLGHRGLLHIPL